MSAEEPGLLRSEQELESSRELASQLLENLAQKLRIKRAAQNAAAGVQRAASYVQNHWVKDMAAAVEYSVRQRPVASLLVAAVAGFLVGRALRPKSTLR